MGMMPLYYIGRALSSCYLRRLGVGTERFAYSRGNSHLGVLDSRPRVGAGSSLRIGYGT